MKKIRFLTLMLLFALFFTVIKDVEAASSVQVHFFNIGQGDATLI
ncbi:hypothetical protein [Carnobacterium sp. ISL-102]|nr:hypothetical protein [Carnobacterium sp. ISL-102]